MKVKVLAALGALLLALLLAKNYNTYCRHKEMAYAIYGYQMSCIEVGAEIEVRQKDKEDYGETFLRLWDWSDKRLLEHGDYMKVKPYIGWKPRETQEVRSDG